MSSLQNAIEKAWTARRFEPVKRNKDGMRWISHRFPIKGGISATEVALANLRETNVLLRRLRDKAA